MKSDLVEIRDVFNGWILRFSIAEREQDGYLPDKTCVAETPEALAGLVLAWAKKTQAKGNDAEGPKE